jgi:hypothetical protein
MPPRLLLLVYVAGILLQVFMDWDNEWGESPHPVQISMGTDALKGLDQLQLLALDVAALVSCCCGMLVS